MRVMMMTAAAIRQCLDGAAGSRALEAVSRPRFFHFLVCLCRTTKCISHLCHKLISSLLELQITFRLQQYASLSTACSTLL